MTDSKKPDNAAVIIRPAYPQDAAAIAAMLSALCAFEGTPTPFTAIEYARHIKTMLESDKSDYQFVMAELDAKPVGFISYYFGFDLSSLSQGAHVGDIFVREEFRKHKVGSKLMAKVAERVLHQSGQWISLTALHSNEDAHNFYQKRSGIAVPVQFYAWGQQGLERLMQKAA